MLIFQLIRNDLDLSVITLFSASIFSPMDPLLWIQGREKEAGWLRQLMNPTVAYTVHTALTCHQDKKGMD